MPVINGVNIKPSPVYPEVDPKKVGDRIQELDKEGFLKIFLANVISQNPMKPMENTEMLQQMAQMTALSASEELKKTIMGLNYNLAQNQILSASQLVGRSVQIPSKTAPMIKGVGISGSVLVTQATQDIKITIKDSKGNIVRTIDKTAASDGLVDFEWDGKDDQGNEIEEGFYDISAVATIDGEKTQLATNGTFKVTSVGQNRQTGEIILNVDGYGGVSIAKVIKII